MTHPRPRWPLILVALIAGIAIGILLWTLAIEPMRRANAAEGAMAMLQEQEAAWNRGDLDGFLKDYEMSDDITFFYGDEIQKGWVQTSDRYQARYGKTAKIKKPMGQLTFSELKPEAMNANTVIIRGRWATQSDQPGNGLFTIIVRKTDVGWKVVHDHTSAKANG